MTIDLTFNEQQQLLQRTAHEFFRQHSTPALVRRYIGGEEEFPPDLWRKMAELGWLGMSLPAEHGGFGCSFLDMYVLYIELGRYLVPGPHLETVAIAGELIAALGTESQKARLLPAIAEGKAIVSFAFMEPDGLYGPGGVAMQARPNGENFVLNGAKVLVPYARSADWFVCAARTSGSVPSEEGISLFLIDARAPGVSIEKTPSMSGIPTYAITFDNVSVSRSDVLGEVGAIWQTLHEVMMKAAVLQAAMVVGAGEHVLDMSVTYAKDRVQFGQPIGRYQAVQYLVTEIALQAHRTRQLALHAAWRIDAGMPFLREASLAMATASRAAAVMTFSAHEVHAGIAFIMDYDLHLYTERAKHWESNLGDQRYHLDRAMAEIGA